MDVLSHQSHLTLTDLKQARNSDAALFWIPAFAGMTSCPPFDGVYPELVEGLRTGSGGHPVFAQSGKPTADLVKAASELCAVFAYLPLLPFPRLPFPLLLTFAEKNRKGRGSHPTH